MIIQLDNYGNSYVFETPDEAVEIDEIIRHFAGLLYSAGFHPSTIARGMEIYLEEVGGLEDDEE
jgi:hypothetical protein